MTLTLFLTLTILFIHTITNFRIAKCNEGDCHSHTPTGLHGGAVFFSGSQKKVSECFLSTWEIRLDIHFVWPTIVDDLWLIVATKKKIVAHMWAPKDF